MRLVGHKSPSEHHSTPHHGSRCIQRLTLVGTEVRGARNNTVKRKKRAGFLVIGDTS